MIIYGINLDSKGRCKHYHTKQDIVALKCGKCQDYFACYQCHNQLRNHPLESVSVKAASPVFCGNCRHFLTYTEYKKGLVHIVIMTLIQTVAYTKPFILRSNL